MKVIIDTNVLMAGLLKDSIVREILLSRYVEFFLPDFSIEEVEKHKKDLMDKGDYTEEEFDKLFSFLLENMKVVSKKEIKPFMVKAEEVMRDIDIKDASFIAAALAIDADGIWSYDEHFKQQEKVRVFDIRDMIGFV